MAKYRVGGYVRLSRVFLPYSFAHNQTSKR